MILNCLRSVRRFCTTAGSKGEIMKYLCVAEKNDAAKTISGFLSRGQSNRREGLSKFNKIYEFEMNFRGQQAKIVFTSVSGHLLTYDFGAVYRNWNTVNPEQLFEAPVIKSCPENFVKIKQTLEREIRSCNGLIIWTDCDREGENIGYEIIDVCKAVKPNISVDRAKFSDMTSTSIHRAMNNLIQPDKRVSDAVDVRSELDLRLGAAFTRFQTLRLRPMYPEQIEKLVSYGSCQIPTLGFVVQRYKEIENFIKKPFWKIKLTHKLDNLTVDFNWARNRLFDKPCTEAFLMLCQADGQVMITEVQQKPKNKWRPLPMDTVELEKTGSRKLRMSAKEIMTTAEKLYTQGFISYPRTETNKFPKEMNLVPLVEMQAQHPDWGEFANRVLEWRPNPRQGNKSDQAHPPIHPTKFTNTLQGNERKVYELVVRHFLACVSRDAVGSETVVSATIGNEDFTATGLIILERNYLDVYVYDKWSGREIHHYEVGHTFRPTELCLHEGATVPPNMLTEADLIALMDKHGIGTDATHAEHIATIKERGYIGVIDQGHLVPGSLGMGLVEGYELMQLKLAEPKLRAGLEVDLKAICDGLKDPKVVLAEQIQKYKECYQTIARQAATLDRALEQRFGRAPQEAPVQIEVPMIQEILKCPKCQDAKMIVRTKKDNAGFYLGCQGYPACKNAVWFPDNVKEVTALDEICSNCGGINKKLKIKFSQVSMLGMVHENPAYSRIDGTHYITCLVCDERLRSDLGIRTDSVKVLGNVVGAGTRPVQEHPVMNQRPANQPARDPPARGFGTNANPHPPANQRRGWGNDDDDDDRPAGGGAVAVSRSNNQGWNNNQQSNGWSNSTGSGWNNQTGSGWNNQTGSGQTGNGWNNQTGSGQTGSGWNNQTGSGQTGNGWNNQTGSGQTGSGWNNQTGNRPNQTGSAWSNNNNSSGWNNSSGANTSSGWGNSAPAAGNQRQPPKINLNKLPNLNCKCNMQASKFITNKEGPNKGRPFYSCQARKCGFFQWADELPAPSNGPSTSGTSSSSSAAAGSKRKCGVCRQEGHNKKSCPSLNNM